MVSPEARRVAINVEAREDLFFFARYMFKQRKGYAWQQASHHALICNKLMGVFRGDVTRLVINVPPR